MRYFILIFLLSSCAGVAPSHKMLKNTVNVMEKKYHIKHADTVLKFGLLRDGNKSHKNSNRLHNDVFASDYGLILNSDAHNKKYIQHINSNSNNSKLNEKSLCIIENNASKKLENTCAIVQKLEQKYAILKHHKSKFSNLCKKSAKDVFDTSNEGDDLELLHELYHVVSHVPLLVPEYHAHLSSKFGMRIHPISKQKRIHSGLDMYDAKHADVFAACNGVVKSVGFVGGYGNNVLIEHHHGLKTRYAHLHKVAVKKGDSIIMGQKIGSQGNSGNVTNDHLHFEIIVNNKPVDPLDFFISQ